MSADREAGSEPMSTADAMSSADAMSTAEAIPAAEALGGVDPMPVAEATETTGPVTPARTEQAGARSRTGGRGLVVGRRLLRLAFAVALFVGGLALGWRVHLANQPVQAITGDPGIVGVETPAVLKELIGAIEDNSSDRIRSVLLTEMFSRYTSEMERFGIATVESVQTLGTYAEGDQSATAIVILAVTVDRAPFSINLVILTQNGQIVRLR